MITEVIIICVCAVCVLAGISFWIYRKKYIPIKHTERYGNKAVKRTYTTINGLMNGQELTFYPNGILASSVEWSNGIRIGQYVEYYDNGKEKQKGEYIDDTKIGERYVYYPTGNINKKQDVINDVPHGNFTVFFPNGKEYICGHYSNGELSGDYIVYALDGSVKLQKRY